MSEAGWLEVGRIVGAQGLQGEVRVYPDSDFPERFLTPGPRWIRRANSTAVESVELVQGRPLPGKGLYVVRFREICDRTQAEDLHNAILLVPESDRPTLESGEFFVADLVGLKVRLYQSPVEIGTVVDIYAAGNDLLAVELYATAAPTPEVPPPAAELPPKATKKKQIPPILVPFVDEIVPVVNLEEGYLEINPPAGLLDR